MQGPWYLAAALGRKEEHQRHPWRRLVALALAAAAIAAVLSACGDSSSDSSATAGSDTTASDTSGESPSSADQPVSKQGPVYHIELVKSAFVERQLVGETKNMVLAFRNYGRNTVPNMGITFGIAGEAGSTSSLPFGIHDSTPGLAQPDRPVWVVAQGYPRLFGSPQSAGAITANKKTFAFGPLKPGQTKKTTWKLSAVRPGKYRLNYQASGDLSSESVTRSPFPGEPPGMYFNTVISTETPDTEVTDSGEVKPTE